ncbi:hypothetical protein H5410_045817 [Solanum commersonii]|uniref:Uncharacterized protein n=1 Tax=Solanum commersonii TaxID=4109 RepID=A0A9J5XCR0_SOLCO|nr:hypothetical protein H5410_045817 [Solanum commersonii]
MIALALSTKVEQLKLRTIYTSSAVLKVKSPRNSAMELKYYLTLKPAQTCLSGRTNKGHR